MAQPQRENPWASYASSLKQLRDEEAAAAAGDLAGHELRVARGTRDIATAIGLDGETVERMAVAARFHDIGKLRIDPKVLNKAGPFEKHEREHMERHAAFGAETLADIPGIDPMMLDAARYHHERYDGNGYEGLAGEDIPLVGRVIAVADVHDALLQKRVYKPARPEAEVLATMTADKRWPDMGRDAFDPAILRAFVALRLADPAFNRVEDERLAALRASGDEPEDVRPGLAEFARSPVPALDDDGHKGPGVP